MFIYTLGDVVGLIFLVVAIIVMGVGFVLDRLQTRKLRRKRK